MHYTLQQIAALLEGAPRYGRPPDMPGPPGVPSQDGIAVAGGTQHTEKYVRLSDNLARDIAASLRMHSCGADPNAMALAHR